MIYFYILKTYFFRSGFFLSKRFFDRAQGTIEYLIIIAIVVVIALVVVGMLTGFLGSSGEAANNSGQIDALAGTYGLSIRDTVADDDRVFFNLTNNSTDPYTITRLEVDGAKKDFSAKVESGASYNFSISDLPSSCTCGAGVSSVSCPVEVSFTSVNGVDRKEVLDLSFECLDFVQVKDEDAVVEGTSAITTCEELQAISEDLSGDYVLGSNVDCSATVNWNSGEGFVPIGDNTNIFTGSFDGRDFNITGLYINRPSTPYQGLFGYVEGASISNVGLVDVNVSGSRGVGGLVGQAYSSSVSSSFASGDVSGFSYYVGGLVGYLEESMLTNSFSSGDVTGSSNYVGGLVGQASSSSVSGSFASGDVSGSSGVGGLVGSLSNNSSVSNSFASGDVSGSSGVGGLVGQASSSSVSNSFASGDVTGSSNVGGLVGYFYSSSVSSSFVSGVVTGSSSVGGLVGYFYSSSVSYSYYNSTLNGMDDVSGKGVGKTTSQMKNLYTYSGWDFVNTWGINVRDSSANNGYPFLRWQGYTHNFDSSSVPVVSLVDVNSITSTGAVVYGELVSKGSYDPVNVHFEYKRFFDDVWTSTSVNSDVSVGVFSATLSDLNSSTSYDYRFIAGFGSDLTVFDSGTFVTDNNFAGGSGRLSDPFLIETCADLQLMNYNQSTLKAHYALSSNVDCSATVNWNSGEGFVPIGDNTNIFTGSFDGRDFNITGLFINRPSTPYQGLFGNTYGASISSVGLVDMTISGSYSVGGLVGFLNNYSSISNSFVSGSVSGSSVGGLVGEAYYSSVSNSFVSGDVSGSSGVGGLVSYLDSSSISNSFVSGDVSGSSNVGGLVGSSYLGSVSNSFVSGDVSGSSSVGGLVGYLEDAMLTNSFVSGDVSGSSNYVGGLVGYSYVGSVSNSFVSGDVSGSADYTGGLVGHSAYTSISGSWSSGSVDGSLSYVGGLVGNFVAGSEISNSYSLSDVSGGTNIGGLVGYVNAEIPNGVLSIENSYSTGAVSGSGDVGGFIGSLYEDDITLSNSYFDVTSSGTVEAVGTVNAGTGAMSCPFLYTFNGEKFEFITDVGGGGGLMYSSPYTPGGVGNPDIDNVPRRPKEVGNVDFMHIGDDQLQAKDGKYVFSLKEDLDEINYMDMVELYVVDHPVDVSVYSPVFNGMGVWVDQNFENKLGYTIKDPLPPVSAFDSFGNDVLRKVSMVDGGYVFGRALEWDTLTVDFGDLSDASQIKLLFNGYNDFASSDDYSARFKYLMQNPDEPFYMYSYPYAEVKNSDGEWVYAPEAEQLFHAHGYPRTNVWDITHWFELNDYTDFSIRIHTHQRVNIDYVAVDTSVDVPVSITKLKPSSAVLEDIGIAKSRVDPVFDDVEDSSIPVDGNFTRFGDVLELVDGVDDRFVVMKPGDGVIFEFDEVPKIEGVGRSYYLHQVGYYKGFEIVKRVGKKFVSVDPLPFNDMDYYHLDLVSPYLDDVDYQEYLREWNTREVRAKEEKVSFGDPVLVEGVTGIFFDAFSGVLGKSTSEMILRNTFANWDFYDVWNISNGSSYPYLRDNLPPVIPAPQ
jgi:hypothetical protein